jgi:replicative DNA helicase
MTIKQLYEHGAVKLTPIEVDQEVERCGGASASEYKKDGGLDFLKKAYEFATPENFGVYYARLKKYSLLRRLKREGYDISEYYIEDKDVENPLKEVELQKKFEDASLEEILNSVEGKYNIIRNEYLNGGKK